MEHLMDDDKKHEILCYDVKTWWGSIDIFVFFFYFFFFFFYIRVHGCSFVLFFLFICLAMFSVRRIQLFCGNDDFQ